MVDKINGMDILTEEEKEFLINQIDPVTCFAKQKTYHFRRGMDVWVVTINSHNTPGSVSLSSKPRKLKTGKYRDSMFSLSKNTPYESMIQSIDQMDQLTDEEKKTAKGLIQSDGSHADSIQFRRDNGFWKVRFRDRSCHIYFTEYKYKRVRPRSTHVGYLNLYEELKSKRGCGGVRILENEIQYIMDSVSDEHLPQTEYYFDTGNPKRVKRIKFDLYRISDQKITIVFMPLPEGEELISLPLDYSNDIFTIGCREYTPEEIKNIIFEYNKIMRENK